MVRNDDVDIVYDYLVKGLSQTDIADKYDYNQREISNILTKDYGLNKGNKAWGTGKENQRGRYSNLSYDDIYDFVHSGSKDIETWIYESNNSDYDDYEDDYDESNYEKPQKKRISVNVNSNGKSPQVSFVSLIFLAILCFVLWLISRVQTESIYFIEYVKMLFTDGYLLLALGVGAADGVLQMLRYKLSISDILRGYEFYVALCIGFVIAAVKFYIEIGVIIPTIILVVLAVISTFIAYKIKYGDE